MEKSKSINRITIVNIVSMILMEGITFLSTPVFSRMMGVENYGKYTSFMTWSSIVSCVFGLQVSSTLLFAAANMPQKEQDAYQSSVLTLGLISFGVLSTLSILFKERVNQLLNLSWDLFYVLFIYALVQMIIAFATAKYEAEFEAGKKLFLSVSSVVLGFVLSYAFFFLTPRENNYQARVLGVLIPNTCISIAFCILTLYRGKTFIKLNYWKNCLVLSIPFVFHMLSGTILSQSDRVMIQRVLGDAQAGIYSLAYTFSSIITIIYMALNNSWTPFYLRYLSQGKNEEIRKHVKNYTELFTVLCVGFLLLSPEVYVFFASIEFQDGLKYVPLLVVANYFIFLYSFPSNFEYYCKNSKVIAGGTILAATLNLGMNYILIIKVGIAGAVIATIVSNLFLFLIHYSCAKIVFKSQCYPLSISMFLPYFAIVLIAALFCWSLGERVYILRWSIGIVLGMFEMWRIKKRGSIM